MKKEELEEVITETFKNICSYYNFYNEKTIDGKVGGTNYKKSDEYIDSLSLSQVVTMGVYDNQFEITLNASCSVLEIENIWNDFKGLVNPVLEDKNYQKFFEKKIPPTYSVSYDKLKIKDRFPNNTKETGWLSFDISKTGIEQFKKVIEFIIEKELLPKLEDYRSLESLDKQLNSSIELGYLDSYNVNSNGILFRRVIIAKLVGNPLFEEICDKEKSFFTDYIELSKEKGYEHYKNIPIVFEEVYNRLKSNKNY
ncbi:MULTISPECIES: hypothetical protein [unclassified Cellulophaga]|uniref:hypothetical protein n=1 Tax=unclassified Cellulophaga TaxID=2634405 RepID=UPI0026E13743|nr:MULTISPECIES: hypothetical protein [unclassified Cellulophaga]MDO6491804.1 hypothetical protein [Cellulophaga sp. 2_MG-2023]MDO6495541.1 hypothetical protein [Cellulophaga sp. 3_MG-2023]